MNTWQKIFLGMGILFIVTLCVFPPQIISKQSVQFLPITYGYPVDWFRLFLWLVVIIFVTGLGIATNKTEHS
ncbi:MAG: hypothetical protein JXB48_03365 [Candidatus Latescibacteria bacterium]|nr:hypothetical protein [Candidatus Latescibacterota bacterium]